MRVRFVHGSAHVSGEAAVVIRTTETAPEWAQTAIEAALSDAGDAEIRRGVTGIAARLWNDMSRRTCTTRILRALHAELASGRGLRRSRGHLQRVG